MSGARILWGGQFVIFPPKFYKKIRLIIKKKIVSGARVWWGKTG
jgi:hypothetical protein